MVRTYEEGSIDDFFIDVIVKKNYEINEKGEIKKTYDK